MPAVGLVGLGCALLGLLVGLATGNWWMFGVGVVWYGIVGVIAYTTGEV